MNIIMQYNKFYVTELRLEEGFGGTYVVGKAKIKLTDRTYSQRLVDRALRRLGREIHFNTRGATPYSSTDLGAIYDRFRMAVDNYWKEDYRSKFSLPKASE